LPPSYFFALGGGRGIGTLFGHFPLPELVPVTRPEASRRVPVTVPAGLPPVVVVPVIRPEASRYCVRPLLPADVRVSALPVIRPLASR
jgi:hypothetical protein